MNDFTDSNAPKIWKASIWTPRAKVEREQLWIKKDGPVQLEVVNSALIKLLVDGHLLKQLMAALLLNCPELRSPRTSERNRCRVHFFLLPPAQSPRSLREKEALKGHEEQFSEVLRRSDYIHPKGFSSGCWKGHCYSKSTSWVCKPACVLHRSSEEKISETFRGAGWWCLSIAWSEEATVLICCELDLHCPDNI